MVGGHHRLDGHELGRIPGDGGQRNLACCILWGHKESDTTERLNRTKMSQGQEVCFASEWRCLPWAAASTSQAEGASLLQA